MNSIHMKVVTVAPVCLWCNEAVRASTFACEGADLNELAGRVLDRHAKVCPRRPSL